ncbi:MAG: helix-turn-helix domain-containing protein, partial [Spiribacter salinus]
MAKLTKDDLVTIQTLTHRGQSPQAIARLLDVDESTIRYHQRRQADPAPDGRAKPFLVEASGLDAVARRWWGAECPATITLARRRQLPWHM